MTGEGACVASISAILCSDSGRVPKISRTTAVVKLQDPKGRVITRRIFETRDGSYFIRDKGQKRFYQGKRVFGKNLKIKENLLQRAKYSIFARGY